MLTKFRSIRQLRPRSGYDVIAVIAMFAALGTGGAYAANMITGAEVVDGSLTGVDIQDKSVQDQDIAPNSITGWSIDESQLGATMMGGYKNISGSTTKNSTDGKSKIVDCPPGTKALSSGYSLDPAELVEVRGITNLGTAVMVTAHEKSPTLQAWSMTVQATCGLATSWVPVPGG